VFAAKGSRDGRQQLADQRRRRRADPGQREGLKQFGLTPLARFVSFAVRGVPPEIMGIGPIEAIPAALKATPA
jgi:acetyl-CoA acyltransferase